MSSLDFGDAIAIIVSCAVYLLPGIFVSKALTGFSGHLTRALPLSICINFLFYQFVGLVGIRQSNFFTVATLCISIAGLVAIGSHKTLRARIQEFLSHGTSVLCGSLQIYIWLTNAGSLGSLIPNHDAMNHSYMIQNIVETGSQRVEDATRLFPLGSGQAGNFYPLGEHSIIASVVRLTGSSVSGQMNLMVFLLSVALFPYFMTFVCEYLFPHRRTLVRIVAPVITVLFMSTFPLSPLSWGGMGVIVAMAYVPGAAILYAETVRNSETKEIILSTLLFVGLFVMHNTEAIMALIFSILIIFFGERERMFKSLVSTSIKVGGLAVLLLWPLFPGLIGGAQDRSIVFQAELDSVSVFNDYLLRFFVGTPQFSLTVLIIASFILAPRRIRTTFGVAFVALGMVCIVAGNSPTNSFVSVLLKPWYGQVLRLNYNVVYFVVPLVVSLAIVVFEKAKPRSISKAFVPLLFLLLVGASMHKSFSIADGLTKHWYRHLVPNSSNSIAAYNFMSNNSDGVVYAMTQSDTISNSSWMYAISGVRPVNATAMTGQGMDKNRPYKIGILENVGRLSEEPELLNWLKKNGIQYFYFDENVNEITPNHEISLDELRKDSALTEVFSAGNAHVFVFNY